ncbi:MAG: glycosyltransferase family 39 protein [Microgenomates group bacterium]
MTNSWPRHFFVILILMLGLGLRLINFQQPIADWHSFRQVDTVSVTRYFTQHGFDFFHPHYYDISSTQSGLENPQGYRMVEAPIYNTITLFVHYLTHQSVENSSRLVSILLSLGSGFLIYLFVYKTTGQFLPSLFSLAIFMFLPFNIYYSRTTLPEPTAVFFMMLSLYLFSDYLYISAISLALAILIKPFTAIIIFPTLVTLIFIHKSYFINHKSITKLATFAFVALLPFILWRWWISQFPEGIPVSNWLLNNGITTTFPTWWHGYNLSFLNQMIALRPHWWYWLFQDRLASLILGIYGIIPLFLGLAYVRKFSQQISLSLVAGILLFFIIVAQGNIQHDYYQVLIIPSISILVGLGYYYIYLLLFPNYFLKIFIILSLFFLSIFFSFDRIKEYYKINNPQIVSLGQVIKEKLPNNSLLIAPYNGDTTLLYYTGLSGWPTEIYDFEKKVSEHPTQPIYLLSLNYDQYTNTLISQYPTIIKENNYIILKISP